MDPFRVIVRILFAYVFALILVRISGHRDLKHIDISSFIVALVIGDMFDDFFWQEVSAAEFVVATGALFLVHIATSVQLVSSGSRTFRGAR